MDTGLACFAGSNLQSCKPANLCFSETQILLFRSFFFLHTPTPEQRFPSYKSSHPGSMLIPTAAILRWKFLDLFRPPNFLPLRAMPALSYHNSLCCTRNGHEFSCYFTTRLAHTHFFDLTSTKVSLAGVCPPIHSALFLFLNIKPIIFLSIALCAVLNVSWTFFLSLQILVP